jgi:hypothetical protein
MTALSVRNAHVTPAGHSKVSKPVPFRIKKNGHNMHTLNKPTNPE